MVVVLTTLGMLSAVSAVAGEAVTRPETRYDERPVTAGVVEPGFPIDHVGVVFELPEGADAHHDHDGDAHAGAEGLAVRFRTDGVWGPWQEMIEDGAQAVGQWTGSLVPGGDAEAYQVRGVPSFAQDVRAAALNTTDGPEVVVGFRPVGSADAVTTCKSRADWRADESLRTSDRSYASPQIMTVHHTATQNDDPDPDARVRAIYEYHVLTNGWDDIGYQALISEDGTVYEGRWSGGDSPSCTEADGTGWEFGHYGTAADAQMVTGAHTGGYNTGNFGIALLGTLSDDGAKSGARGALVEYLAEFAERHGIDPESQIDYDNGVNAKTVDAVSGHRDFTATECPGAGLYDDLPTIRTDVATAIAADAGPTVTIVSPSDADSYTAQETEGGAGATFTLAAESSDTVDGWKWTDGNGAISSSSSFETTQQVGTVTYTATATDADARTGTDAIEVTVLAAEAESSFVDDVASGETSLTGTVSGDYLDTHVSDDQVETITETETGGRPSLRHSELEHRWSIDVTGGSSLTLFVDAAATTSDDGDGFAFEYSTDNGSTYEPALVVPAGGSGVYSAALADTVEGSVEIRVRDTNRAQGANTLDSIAIDHLYIRSETEAVAAPSAPASITAEEIGATTVGLGWSGVEDAWGYELERGTEDGSGTAWTRIAELGADVTSYTDTGLTGSTTYGYRVRAYNSGGASAWTETSVETLAPEDIALTASGYKDKGSHTIDLAWTGAAKVNIHRDGGLIAAGVSGTSYTDATGGKGRGEYTHRVCAVDDEGAEGSCSNEVMTSFS